MGAWHDGSWHPRMPGRFLPRRVRLFGPVVFSLVVQVASVVWLWNHRGLFPNASGAGPFWLQLLLAIVGPLALLGARRWPGPVVAFVAVAACVDLFVGVLESGPPYIALAFAIVGAVVRGARVWAWISVSVSWVASVTLASVTGASWPPARIATTTLGILILFGIAEGIRTRRDRYEQMARVANQRRQSEVQAERVRIARELHDVLAHSLSQINVQAGVGLHLMDANPDKAKDALASIKLTSKTALDEVRSVLGVLRADAGTNPAAPLVPEPDLSRIAGLAASVTSQGIDVTVNGAPQNVPQSIQLAIYRIVQESLTNVARHAHAAHVIVDLAEDAGFYRVTVTDDGIGVGSMTASAGQDGAPGGDPVDAGGRGLLGMRERAELLGGTMSAGPIAGGTGFRVSATIPIREKDSRP